jgi:hypothetical protein
LELGVEFGEPRRFLEFDGLTQVSGATVTVKTSRQDCS